MKRLLCFLIIMFIPIKIFAYSDYVSLGGKTLGIKVDTKGVMVIGFYKVNGKYNKGNPALANGDYIIKVNDINVETFIKALYNTKKIEYYLNDDKLPEECSSRLELPSTDSIDISGIKDSALTRYYKIEKLKKAKKNDFESLVCYLLYEEHLSVYLSSNIGKIISSSTNDGIKRDMLNMRLLKTLKREKVRKEIDNR